MSTAADAREDGGAILLQIKEHLRMALDLLDGLDPYAVAGARLQHCIDDIEEMIAAPHGSEGD